MPGSDLKAAAADALPCSHALLIGVDRYQHDVPVLRNAVADAQLIAADLERCGFSVTLLTNERATCEAIRQQLRLLASLPEASRVVIYIASHGAAASSGTGMRGFIVPFDGKRGTSRSFLAMDELYSDLEFIVSRHVLLILDCCFAGAFRWASARDALLLPERLFRQRLERFARHRAWQVLTSAAHDERALDVLDGAVIGERGDAAHSPFATFLHEGLQGAADLVPASRGDGIITCSELALFLRERFMTAGISQTPALWFMPRHDRGEFFFVSPARQVELPDAPELSLDSNPWCGLASYDATAAARFFGREAEIEAALRRLEQSNVLAVIGGSGVGKSSLVSAGLVPALARMPDMRLVGPLRLAGDPLRQLLAALGESPAESTEQRAASEALPERILLCLCRARGFGRVVLVFDQFEEIFLDHDSEARRQFLQVLRSAAADHGIYVVFSVRSAFDTALQSSPLGAFWPQARFGLGVLPVTETRRVVERPASAICLFFEDSALVDSIVDEAAQFPGSLPLLSFVLSELYRLYLESGAEDRVLRRVQYRQLKGVSGALNQRAEAELQAATPLDRQLMRSVFMRTFTFESGTLTRRRIAATELIFPPAVQAAVTRVVRRLADSRLLVSTSVDNQDFLELAHDALLRSWETLRDWIASAADELSLRTAVGTAAESWLRHGSDPDARDYLWSGDPRLSVAWQAAADPHRFNAREIRFLQASLQEQRRRSAARRTSIVAVSVALLAGALTVTWFRGQARERQFLVDLSGRSAEVRAQLATATSSDGLATALNAAADALARLGEVPDATLRSLFEAVYGSREVGNWASSGWAGELAYSDDGRQVVHLYRDANVDRVGDVLDAATGRVLSAIRSPTAPLKYTWLIAGGSLIATAPEDETAPIAILDWHGARQASIPRAGIDMSAIEALPGGTHVAIGNADGTVCLIATRSLARSCVVAAQGKIASVEVGRSGRMLYVRSDSSNELIRVAAPALKVVDRHKGIGERAALAILPDEEGVLFSDEPGHVSRLSFRDAGITHFAVAGIQRIDSIRISNDGERVAIANETPGQVWLFRSNGRPMFRNPLNGTATIAMALHPHQPQLVWGTRLSGNLHLLDLNPVLVPSRIVTTGFVPRSIDLCRPDGRVVWGDVNGMMGISDLRATTQPMVWKAHEDYVERVACSASGELYSRGRDGSLRRWSPPYGNATTHSSVSQHTFNDFALRPDGRVIIAQDDTRILWLENGSERVMFDTDLRGVTKLAVDWQRGRIVIASNDGRFEVRAQDGATLVSPVKAHLSSIFGVALAPQGDILATGGTLGSPGQESLAVWSSAGRRLASLDGNLSFVTSLTFDARGRMLVSGGADGIVRLWDRNLLQLGDDLLGHSLVIAGVAFEADGESLVTAGGDGSIREWHIGPLSMIAKGCSQLARLRQYDVRWVQRELSGERSVRYCRVSRRTDG